MKPFKNCKQDFGSISKLPVEVAHSVKRSLERFKESARRAVYHNVLEVDYKNKQLKFENHIPFADMTKGAVFAARTLLETSNS